ACVLNEWRHSVKPKSSGAPARHGPDNANADLPFSSSAILGSFVASAAGRVAEETRTRGFAAPAFAGCALIGFGTDTLLGGTSCVKKRKDGKDVGIRGGLLRRHVGRSAQRETGRGERE